MPPSRYSPSQSGRRRTGMLRVSYSDLSMYLKCGRMKYFKDSPGIPKVVDYPRLGGIAVHDHIKQIHTPTKDNRPFFYKTKRSALNAYWFRWTQELELSKSVKALINPNPDDDEKFLNIGRFCISNYWNATEGKPKPLEVEKRYTVIHEHKVKLIGIFDQTRQVSLEYVEKHRPELLQDGRLHPDFDPVVIMDHKTEFPNYDPTEGFQKEISDRDWIRSQFELHEYLQPSFYTWLYWKRHGKWPLGFIWYHMRTNRGYFTFRDKKDLAELFHAIDHYVDNHNAGSYPKNVGKGCKRCDYFMICHGDRPFLRSYPEQLFTMEGLVTPTYVNPPIVEVDKQLRLKLKVGRRVRKTPEIPVSNPETFVIRELPVQIDLQGL